jgi:hypothetical protein
MNFMKKTLEPLQLRRKAFDIGRGVFEPSLGVVHGC